MSDLSQTPLHGAGASCPRDFVTRHGDRVRSAGTGGEGGQTSPAEHGWPDRADHRWIAGSRGGADHGIWLASGHRTPSRPVANSLVKALIDFWHPTRCPAGMCLVDSSTNMTWSRDVIYFWHPTRALIHRVGVHRAARLDAGAA